VAPEAADAELIAISRREGRILMSFDRDICRHFVAKKRTVPPHLAALNSSRSIQLP
jgi:predicted nuclease of predicted toxin-antitoxin system